MVEYGFVVLGCCRLVVFLVGTAPDSLLQITFAAIGVALDNVAEPILIDVGARAIRVCPVPSSEKSAPEIRTGAVWMLQICLASHVTHLVRAAAVGILPIGSPGHSRPSHRLAAVWK